MAATITIDGETRTPKADIRVLGGADRYKAKMGASHLKKNSKIESFTQTQALTKITASLGGGHNFYRQDMYTWQLYVQL